MINFSHGRLDWGRIMRRSKSYYLPHPAEGKCDAIMWRKRHCNRSVRLSSFRHSCHVMSCHDYSHLAFRSEVVHSLSQTRAIQPAYVPQYYNVVSCIRDEVEPRAEQNTNLQLSGPAGQVLRLDFLQVPCQPLHRLSSSRSREFSKVL